MRNPDDALRFGLRRQIASLEDEIKRVEQHLAYLRSEKGRTIERLLAVPE